MKHISAFICLILLLFFALTLFTTQANGIPYPWLKRSVRNSADGGSAILSKAKSADGDESDNTAKAEDNEDNEDIWQEIAEQAECGNCNKRKSKAIEEKVIPGATNCGSCEHCATCDTVYFSCYEEKCIPCGEDGDCATNCHAKQCVPRRIKCLQVLCPALGAKPLISVAPFAEDDISQLEPSASPEMFEEPVDMFDAVAGKI